MQSPHLRPTNDNFDRYAVPVLARWLIEAAHVTSAITYGEAKLRLERDHGFFDIGRATRLGYCAGELMYRIQKVVPDAPLLNVLLVLQGKWVPSSGAGGFMAQHFGKPVLAKDDIRQQKPDLWRKYFDLAADEVYAYPKWPQVFSTVFGRPYQPDESALSPANPKGGTEKDGIIRGRGGEGPNHEALRLWVKNNPAALYRYLDVNRAKTEVDLLSGDRVDVVYYTKDHTIALEVKSKDSNEADLTRGIYQCVKYRAVLQAMDPREHDNVDAVLVTQLRLPGYLKELAKRLDVSHKLVSPTKKQLAHRDGSDRNRGHEAERVEQSLSMGKVS